MNDESNGTVPREHPLFTVTGLGAGAESATFAPHSVKELKDWLQAERDFWMWLKKTPYSEAVVGTMRNRQFWADDEIKNFVEAYELNPNANVAHIVKAGQRIASRYQQERALHSSSPLAVYVAGIGKKDARVAAAAASIFNNENPQNPDRFTDMGAALAATFLFGPATPSGAFKAAWVDTQTLMSTEHENLRKTAGAAAKEWKEREKEIGELHGQQRKLFDENQATRETDFKKLIDAHQKQIDQIREAFKKDMALKSAVEYFTKKGEAHGTRAGVFAAFSILFAIGALVVAFVFAAPVFADTKNPATFAQIGLTVVCAFLALWTLRLLVRVLLSNLHLATDMRNRATLVQTYLALILEGGALKDGDRATIVSLIFRPVSDGLVRDDGAPPTPFAVVQEMMTGTGNRSPK